MYAQTLRQLMFPSELRIGPPVWPEPLRERLAESIERAIQLSSVTPSAPDPLINYAEQTVEPQEHPSGKPEEPPLSDKSLKFLADVATGIWRMRRNMVPRGTDRMLDARPLEEMRKPFRWLQSTWDTLNERGLEIQDHTGDRYIPGQSLKAIFEAHPDLREDTIIDTIRPTVYFEGKIIQMGEVVVGTPDLAE